MWQQNVVSKVLSHMGWGSGFRLPIANKENLELERVLERLQRQVSEAQVELEDDTKHCESLKDQIKHMTEHISQGNKLKAAKHTELMAEKELHTSSERELERTRSELRRSHQQFMELKKRSQDLCNDLETRKQHVSELVDLINYDRKELTRLEKSSEEQDAYLKMLEDVCDADAEVVKRCEERYKAAGEAVAASKAEMEKEVALTLVAHNELDGLAERFRNLHKERSEVVNLWKSTLVSLQSRDEEMHCVAEEFTGVHLALKEKELELESKKSSLDGTRRITSTSEAQLSRYDRIVSDIRSTIKDVTDLGESFEDGIMQYETSIALVSQETKALRESTARIDKELSQIQAKISTSEDQLADLNARADTSKMEALTASDKIKQISSMIDEEEKKLESFGKQLEQEMKRKSQWLAKKMDLTQESQSLDHSISCASTMILHIREEIKKAAYTFECRKSHMYKAEVQVISLEHKITMLTNPEDLDPTSYNQNKDKLINLHGVLREIIHNKSFLNVQTGHLDNVIRRIQVEEINGIKEIQRKINEVNQSRMDVKSLENSLNAMDKNFLDLVVDRSLTKLKLAQLEKSVREQKSYLYDAESHKTLLQSACKEKRSEIEMHVKLLLGKRKSLVDEIGHFRHQLNQIRHTMDIKRKRYEITMQLMASSQDPSDMQSEAYLILRVAQEREMLKKEGDMWDQKVKETETETEALQNTVSVVHCSNELFKDSLKPMLDEGFQSQMKQLEQKQRDARNRKNKALKELNRLDDEFDAKAKQLEILHLQHSHSQNKLMEKELELRALQADVRDLDLKIKRSRSVTMRLLQKLNFSGENERNLKSLDIRLRVTQRKLEFALNALAKFLKVYSEFTKQVGQFLCENMDQEVAFRFMKLVMPGSESSLSMSPVTSDHLHASHSEAKSIKSHAMIRTPSLSPSPSGKKLARHSAFDTRTESHQKILRSVASAVDRSRKIVLDQRQQESKKLNEVQDLKDKLESLISVRSSSEKDKQDRPIKLAKGHAHFQKRGSGASSAEGSISRSSGGSVNGVKNRKTSAPPPTPTTTPANEVSDPKSKVGTSSSQKPEELKQKKPSPSHPRIQQMPK